MESHAVLNRFNDGGDASGGVMTPAWLTGLSDAGLRLQNQLGHRKGGWVIARIQGNPEHLRFDALELRIR